MRSAWLGIGIGSWALATCLGCGEPDSPQPASRSTPAPAPTRRRSTFAERLEQGRHLTRVAPRRRALDQALSQQDPARQLSDTRRELGLLREEGVRFALRRHDASAPLTLREAESLRDGIRVERDRPTLAVVIELRLGVENELPLQITARELYRPTYELLIEHLRGERGRR